MVRLGLDGEDMRSDWGTLKRKQKQKQKQKQKERVAISMESWDEDDSEYDNG
jgi:hypothetical protein